jgi:hypothetical protein
MLSYLFINVLRYPIQIFRDVISLTCQQLKKIVKLTISVRTLDKITSNLDAPSDDNPVNFHYLLNISIA